VNEDSRTKINPFNAARCCSLISGLTPFGGHSKIVESSSMKRSRKRMKKALQINKSVMQRNTQSSRSLTGLVENPNKESLKVSKLITELSKKA